MAVKWSPDGFLDVATDPADLPESSDGKSVTSGAMTRCTNLHLDRMGIAITRLGSHLVLTHARMPVHCVVVMSGSIYAFVGDAIYRDGILWESGLVNAAWSAFISSAYNVTRQDIFALNGSNRKRIGASVHEWGVDPPEVKMSSDTVSWVCTHDWEKSDASVADPALESGYTWACTYPWEKAIFEASSGSTMHLFTNTDGVNQLSAVFDWEVVHNNGLTLIADKYPYKVIWDFELDATWYLPATARKIRKFTETAIDPVTLEEFECVFDWEVLHSTDETVFADANTRKVMYFFELYDPEGKAQLVYTLCRKSGGLLEYESNPSPALDVQLIGALAPQWDAGVDEQITHVRTYRTLENQSTLYYESEFAIDEDDPLIWKRDSALGAEVAYDHDRPPVGAVALGPNYNGTCFIGSANKLYYCKPQQPEYWPALYYVEVGPSSQPLVALTYFNGQVHAASRTEIYSVQGTGHESIFPLPTSALTGTQARQCFYAVAGQGIYHLGPDGIYLFSGSVDQKISQSRLDPIFKGESRGSIPGINLDQIENCWMVQVKNKLWFGYPGSGSTYSADVLVTDITTSRNVHYQYPFEMTTAVYDELGDRLLVGDSDGNVRNLEVEQNDDGADIAWDIESKQFSQLRKYFPRYARYDVEVQDGATATGEISLNYVVKQSHSITASRSTRKRLVAGCNGDNVSLRIHGSGSVKIYAAEVE